MSQNPIQRSGILNETIIQRTCNRGEQEASCEENEQEPNSLGLFCSDFVTCNSLVVFNPLIDVPLSWSLVPSSALGMSCRIKWVNTKSNCSNMFVSAYCKISQPDLPNMIVLFWTIAGFYTGF